MDRQLLKAYYEEMGSKYLHTAIFEEYPETKMLPAYIREHFADARRVLDLGFGTGLWFWATFLPALERIDGIDLHGEALEEADKVLAAGEVPPGYRLAHERLGEAFTLRDLHGLKTKRGEFVIQDFRDPWPNVISGACYDLVAEHGGGLGLVDSEDQFFDVIERTGDVLRPSGCFLFMNFRMQPTPVEEEIGLAPAPTFRLSREHFFRGVAGAGMRMVDFHEVERPSDMPTVDTLFFGYAQRRISKTSPGE